MKTLRFYGSKDLRVEDVAARKIPRFKSGSRMTHLWLLWFRLIAFKFGSSLRVEMPTLPMPINKLVRPISGYVPSAKETVEFAPIV